MSTLRDALTIIIPFKDRLAHTARLISYLQFSGFPGRIIFADGCPDPAIATLMADRAAFPNLAYTYIRHPPSDSLAGLFARMRDAADQVETPYVVWHSNDDFYFVETLQRAVAFLDANPDYVGATGELADFMMQPRPEFGPLNRVYGALAIPGKVFRAQSYPQPQALDRLNAHTTELFNNGPAYSICRAPLFREIWRTIVAANPPDWHFADRYFVSLLLAAGKLHGEIGYLALHQSDGFTAGLEMITRDPTWYHWCQRPEWLEAFNTLVQTVGEAIAAREGGDPAVASNRFRYQLLAIVGRAVVDVHHPEGRIEVPMPSSAELVGRLQAYPETQWILRFLNMATTTLEQRLAAPAPAPAPAGA